MSDTPTTSKNPYIQIALTYLRWKKMFWSICAIFLLLSVMLTLHALQPRPPQLTADPFFRAALADPRSHDEVVQILEMLAKSRAVVEARGTVMPFFFQAWILLAILSHLKEQIVSPRAVLVPNYRRPHLLVAAAFALLPLLLIPLGISVAFALPFLAVLAIGTLFSALALWALYFPKWPLVTILFLMPFLSLTIPPGQPALFAALANTATGQNLLFIALGLAAIAGLGQRLMRLREEMPEYSRQIFVRTMAMPQSTQSPAPQISYDNPVTRLIDAPFQRQLAGLATSKSFSLWARLKRWQLGGNPPQIQWLFTSLLVPFTLFLAFTLHNADAQLMAFQLVFFPAIGFPQSALVVWRTLGLESLRPIRRVAYLRERAAALALPIAQIWLILAAAVLACTAIVKPESLSMPTFWLTLAASALVQFPLFAVSVWLLRYRSPFATIASTGLFVGIGSAAAALCSAHRFALSASWLVVIILAILLVSALILRDAYRRWLRTDLA